MSVYMHSQIGNYSIGYFLVYYNWYLQKSTVHTMALHSNNLLNCTSGCMLASVPDTVFHCSNCLALRSETTLAKMLIVCSHPFIQAGVCCKYHAFLLLPHTPSLGGLTRIV